MRVEDHQFSMAADPATDSLQETLGVFDDSGGTPLTTTEVADRLDVGRRSTYDRLERLAERDHLETKKVGARGRIWWRPPASSSDRIPSSESPRLARDAVNRTTRPDAERASPPATDDVPAGGDSVFSVGPLAEMLDEVAVGVFVLDEDFHVAWINETTERYFGIDREEVVGKAQRELIGGRIAPMFENPESFAETVLSTYEDNSYTERFECHVTAGDGRTERWLEHRSEPIQSGPFAGGRVELYYDLTDRKRSERALYETEQRFRALVDAAEEYAIFRLDLDGRVQSWNEGAQQIKGYEPEEIVGEPFSTFYPEEDRADGVPEANLAAAAVEGVTEDEGWRVRKDGSRFWARVTITPIHGEDGEIAGYVKVTRDETDRHAREQAVRRQRDRLATVLEASPVGIGIFDAEGEAIRVNQRFTDLLGRSGDDPEAYVLGEQPLLDEDGEWIPYPERPAARVLATGEPVHNQRIRVDGPDGETRWLSVNAEPLPGDTGGVVVTMADVTQIKAQARRLERKRAELERELEDVIDRIDDGFFALDRNLRFTEVTDRVTEVFGRSPGELVGEHIWEVLEPGPKASAAFDEALATQESITFEEYYEPFETWFENHVYPSESGLSVYFRDVTERKARERQLEEYEHIVETVSDGIYVIDEDLRIQLVNEAYTSITGYSREELVGSHISMVVDEDVVDFTLDQRERMRAEAAAVTADPNARVGETGGIVEVDLETASGEQVTVEARYAPLYGADAEFRGSVGVIRDVTERKERERELERKRERLRALDELNGVFRDITDAVIEQSTREEIEEIVCERLAESDSYLFAWIGDVDVQTQTVTARTEAGVEGYLDGITISVDPDDDRSKGPTGRAILEREMQVTQDIRSDSRHDPWRDHVRRYGFRSSAAIPIVHGDTVYGVLNVYAERANAFTSDERAVIGQLGEVIGHAIAAVERKRALMSEEVVELEFQIPDVFDAIDVPGSGEGTITFDRTVPLDDESFLVYGTATGTAMRTVEEVVESETLPHWESVGVVSADREETRFELVLTESPILSTVAAYGGYVDAASIEDSDYYMRIYLAPSTDVRTVVDAIEDTYPGIELAIQRQVTRDRSSLTRARGTLLEDLTERQRSALEAAYQTGYFAWPRRSTGEDVAESFDVSPSTFHQHLRKAEERLLTALFEDEAREE